MKVKEQVMRWVFAATAAFSIAAVALICVFLFLNGLPFFTKYDLGAFLSGTTWKPANNIFGILPMIVGSLYVTGGALLFGAPVGILAGIYLARFCPVRLRKIIEPMIGLMAGVPSIVYGFFGLTTLLPLIREMFGGRGRGQCILTASLLLGIMILPTIIQLTSAAVKAVPNSYYEGSLALGATDERSVFRALLADMGLESIYDKLPPLKYSGEICGYITEDVAGLTGLKAGTPVAGGCMDIHASAMAVGITDEEKMCVVAGTWSINEYISKKPVVDKDLFMTSIYTMPGYWMILEGSPTSASNLEWFLAEILKDVNLGDKDIYEYSNKCVDGIGDQDCGVVFLPFLFGSNVNINAKGAFIGLQSWHTRENLLRAVYEGIVFCHKYHIEKLLKFRDQPKMIRMAGGVAKSEIWVQMFADILQVPIEVARSQELGALGSAICAGIATVTFDSFQSASESMVDIMYTAEPNPEKFAEYDKKYARYKKVIEALDPIWDEY